MIGAKHANERRASYATAEDFCRIFADDMNCLYLLSFLLTADHEEAEQCFVSGLADSTEGRPVFKEWARSWARRTIIQNAVRVVVPRPLNGIDRSKSVASNDNRTTPAARPEISAILGLRSVERFVFIMSVLEGYSDQDCSVLLGCARRDVIAARTRALHEIGSSTTLLNHNRVGGSSEDFRSYPNFVGTATLLAEGIERWLGSPAGWQEGDMAVVASNGDGTYTVTDVRLAQQIVIDSPIPLASGAVW